MHTQEVFNAIYKKHHYEYIIIDKEMEIIEFSDKVFEYCDKELLKSESIDLYRLVPELYGLESQFEEFFSDNRELIEIPMVKKGEEYVNISVNIGRKDNYAKVKTLIILFENITDYVIMHQQSVQDRNDKELLLFEVEKKNSKLLIFNQEMEKLVKQETKKNLKLNEDIITTQQEVIATMGAIGETRSKETGEHVLRVAEYSRLLALKAGLSQEEADILKMASPMHDIGKVGIEDSILNKPGKLTKAEFEIMKTHAQLGYKMLSGSSQKLLQTAAIVAYAHHEKWNGEGYPLGLRGEDIHIYGRITAIIDVFDALSHDRVYKKAWPLEQVLELLQSESGKHFDPTLIDLFFKNIDEFLEIRDAYIH